MIRLLSAVMALALGLGACALNVGAGRDIPVTTVVARANAGVAPAEMAAALRATGVRAAIVAAPADAAWFQSVAGALELHVSGPAEMGDLELAFLAPEPLGDTTITLPYDGGQLTVHDALYELAEDRLLDLIGFRIDDPAEARPAIRALLEYVATDVDNSAALVMAAVVPTAAVGDSLARMLSPAYYDALRCEVGSAAPSDRAGIRLFYGPEARLYCTGATAEGRGVGEWVRADLVMGRR